MHVEFAPGFSEGTDKARLSDPVLQTNRNGACRIARSIYEELLQTDAASAIAFEGLSLLLLAETVREVSRENNMPRWLRRVRERLYEEYVAVPSLKQIAGDVGVHPTYLATSFRQHFSLTIGEFVRLRRVEKAREMLSDSDRPLSEVALLLGFSDQSHFCRTFKTHTSLSPLEYRRLFSASQSLIQKP